MSPEVTALLARFDSAAIKLFPPAAAEDIRLADARIGFALPPSMKSFLAFSNGMQLSYASFYGITSGSAQTMQHGSVEEDTERWRVYISNDASRQESRGLPPDPAIVSTAIAIVGGEGTGDVYVLMEELRDGTGECPVALIDHENLNLMGIVASTYERFLWFFIDEISRQAYPTGELKLDEDEIPPSDWPFENKAWMLEHDPGLAKWL